MLRLGGLLYALLIGCGTRPLAVMPEPTLYVDTVAVADAINAAAGEPLIAIGVEVGSTVWIREACGGFEYDVVTVAACGRDRSILQMIITHELGHAFGLGHSNDPASVMFKRAHLMTVEEAAASLVEELRR